MKKDKLAEKHRKYATGAVYSGKIIVLEGNDGSGKSTTAKYLNRYLNSIGQKSTILKFNMSYITLSSIKKGKKNFFGPVTNTLLHMTSIIDQFERYIYDRLMKGEVIICDRYIYSVIARGIVRGVDEKLALTLEKWVIKPDIVFYLDIEPYSALARRGENNITYWEAGKDMLCFESDEMNFIFFQNSVRKIFLENANLWNFKILNAEKPTEWLIKEIVNYLNEM